MNGARARRAVFLDRDGTLIEDLGYPREPKRVRLLEGAAEALAQLRDCGLTLVLIGNQSGIGRGLVTEDEARAVHDRFVGMLAAGGLTLDAVRYCPHAPWERCECRKPLPGMLNSAAVELGIDVSRSFMVGDKASDVEAGRRAGARTVLLGDVGDPDAEPDHRARNWSEAVRFILQTVAAR